MHGAHSARHIAHWDARSGSATKQIKKARGLKRILSSVYFQAPDGDRHMTCKGNLHVCVYVCVRMCKIARIFLSD